MKKIIRVLKWVFLVMGACYMAIFLFEVGYTLAHFREFRMYPPMEQEFRAVQVGMSKEQVLQLFRPKLCEKDRRYYSGVGFQTDRWSFGGTYSEYIIAFDANTHLVSTKHKSDGFSNISDVNPRNRDVRWLWEKWDQLR